MYQERRDFLLGRCFAFKSLVQSKILFQSKANLSDWDSFLEQILKLASETLWLRKECGLTLHEALVTLTSIKDLTIDYVSVLLSKLHAHNLAKTPEGIAIWVTAASLFPAATLPTGVWNNQDPLSGKERATVAKILRDNGSPQNVDGSSAPATSTGSAQNIPSFAWQAVFTQLHQRHESGKKADKMSEFEKFWVETVDSRFSATTLYLPSDRERQMACFLLLPAQSAKLLDFK